MAKVELVRRVSLVLPDGEDGRRLVERIRALVPEAKDVIAELTTGHRCNDCEQLVPADTCAKGFMSGKPTLCRRCFGYYMDRKGSE